MTACETGICNGYYFKPTVYHTHTHKDTSLTPKKVTTIKFTLYHVKIEIPKFCPVGFFLAVNGNAAHISHAGSLGSLLPRCIRQLKIPSIHS